MKRKFVKNIIAIVLWSVVSSFSFKPVHSILALNICAADTIQYPEETHLRNVQQLTFGGDNAEAYWSYDSKYLVFQRTNAKEGLNCDQIFIGKVPQKAGEKLNIR